MKNVKYFITALLIITTEIAYSQSDSSGHKKIVTGWSVGHSWDIGACDNKSTEPIGFSYYAALEFYNRLYVGIYGMPTFGDYTFFESDKYYHIGNPTYEVAGSSFGTYIRPLINCKKKPLRISIPIYISCVNIRVKRKDWSTMQEEPISIKRIINKHCTCIRPGIMLEVNLTRRIHLMAMYSHSICLCDKLYDKQNGKIVYDKGYYAHWITTGVLFGNYFKNPKVKTCIH
ncbi:MAG: hypothetical protein J6X05_08225 [Bacteroidales bacterium]|nr:hypothetical protein [Bacteroidales bacterium]